MDGKTLTALKQSIEKWERNAEAEMPWDYLLQGTGCPLCALSGVGCEGCPVYEKTGKKQCVDTPWRDAHDAWADWSCNNDDDRMGKVHAAAREEVKFLQSLLPEENTK